MSVKSRILKPGATAKVAPDSIYVPGQIVTVVRVTGTQPGFDGCQAPRRVRAPNGKEYDLPLDFLEPTEEAIQGAITRMVSPRSEGIELK